MLIRKIPGSSPSGRRGDRFADCQTRTSHRNLAVLALAFGGVILSQPGFAQVKVGSSPTSLASDVNFQAEASDGGQVVVRKSTAQVGIGTSSPANKLEVVHGTAGNSGVRLTSLPNAAALGTNASGDVVSVAASSSCECGDVKASLKTANHGDWKLMDGTPYTVGSCSYAIDARSRLLAMDGNAAGTPSDGTVMTQSQLPSVVAAGSTSVAGGHSHTTDIRHRDQRPGYSSTNWNPSYLAGDINTEGGYAVTDTQGSHSHTVSLNLNPGIQVPLNTNNLARISINYFVCVK